MNFSVTLILQVGGTEVQSHVELLENYESGTQVQLLFPNVSYCGAWQVQVFASNHLGDSEYSVLSLTSEFMSGGLHALTDWPFYHLWELKH